MVVLAGNSGIYEILLITLVVILIFNGLKRQKIMNKVDANLSNNSKRKPTSKTVPTKEKTQSGEYVDFEEISE